MAENKVPWTPGPIAVEKCGCGRCEQYRLSTQGGVGFSLADATLYAAAPEMAELLRELRRNMRNSVTGAASRATWNKVNALVSRIEGAADA